MVLKEPEFDSLGGKVAPKQNFMGAWVCLVYDDGNKPCIRKEDGTKE